MTVDWGTLLSTFGLVFIAELGDKTQLAVVTQVCKHRRPLAVFLGASLALAMVTALGAIGGRVLGTVIPASALQIVAALAFIVMGSLIAVEITREYAEESEQEAVGDVMNDQCEEMCSRPVFARDWRAFSSTLGLVFIAEMGDKTQLAVLSLAGEHASGAWPVFIGGALALTAVTALGVVGGQALCAILPERLLLWISAVTFVVMGVLIGFGVL